MADLSVKECLRVGWQTFRMRSGIFVGAGVILFIASLIGEAPRMGLDHMHGALPLSIAATLFSVAVSFLVNLGKTAFFLRAHDAPQGVRVADLWHPRGYWRFVGASVLAGLTTVLGLLLLIVPGIIFGVMFSLALYVVVDRGLGPIEALKESARLTKGNRWNLFLLGLAILGINILGFCALIIGLFVSLPVSALAVVHAYRVLSRDGAVPVPAA